MAGSGRRKTTWTKSQHAEFKLHVWRHNALLGRARSARMSASAIADASSACIESRKLAGHIETLLRELEIKLRSVRVDDAFPR